MLLCLAYEKASGHKGSETVTKAKILVRAVPAAVKLLQISRNFGLVPLRMGDASDMDDHFKVFRSVYLYIRRKLSF